MPQGGNTGLVGGNTPMGEVLLSLKKMTSIRDINPTANSMIVEAGATVQAVHDAADEVNRKFPMLISSQGSCTVGGILSTNAGGNHVLKYGTTKELVFGVEAVLADGSIYNGLTNLRKDNTGYDLSRLFLGAEGPWASLPRELETLPQTGSCAASHAGGGIAASRCKSAGHAQRRGKLAMFEVMPRIGFTAVTDNFEGVSDPFRRAHPWYILVDWEVDTESEGMELAEALLGAAFEAELIQDAVIAQSETQALALLNIRENMSAGQKFLGGSIKHDITVPIDKIPEFFKRADAKMQDVLPGCRPVGFGHFGDGNIHYNVAQPEGSDREIFLARWDDLSQPIFDICDQLGGSISAEHGIGHG